MCILVLVLSVISLENYDIKIIIILKIALNLAVFCYIIMFIVNTILVLDKRTKPEMLSGKVVVERLVSFIIIPNKT